MGKITIFISEYNNFPSLQIHFKYQKSITYSKYIELIILILLFVTH